MGSNSLSHSGMIRDLLMTMETLLERSCWKSWMILQRQFFPDWANCHHQRRCPWYTLSKRRGSNVAVSWQNINFPQCISPSECHSCSRDSNCWEQTGNCLCWELCKKSPGLLQTGGDWRLEGSGVSVQSSYSSCNRSYFSWTGLPLSFSICQQCSCHWRPWKKSCHSTSHYWSKEWSSFTLKSLPSAAYSQVRRQFLCTRCCLISNTISSLTIAQSSDCTHTYVLQQSDC